MNWAVLGATKVRHLWLAAIALALVACDRPDSIAGDPAATSESTDVSSSWNQPLPRPDPKATYFLWSPDEQLIGYRNMEKVFPSRRVAAGPYPRPLPIAERDLDVGYDRDGATWTTETFMNHTNVVGLLVIHHGEIVLERYRHGYDATQRWVSFSVAKSFASTLVGAAIKDGAIGSLDDLITAYLPTLGGSAYDGVTVRQLLTMTTGTAWNEDYEDPESDVARIKVEPAVDGADPIVAYMSRITRAAEPGTRFQYNTGETHLVGSLVRAATGKHLADYLSEKIWIPLGMELDASWLLTKGESEQAGCCLSASLRDFGRFGLFFMNGGTIDDDRVLPDGWVEIATTPTEQSRASEIILEGEAGYGFMWWILDGGAYNAQGIFGQYIYINPTLDLVVVVQSAWPTALGGFDRYLDYPHAVEEALTR